MTELLSETEKDRSAEDDVSTYLREIRRYPRLTPEQERELAARGDEEARDALVKANLRLVLPIAREYAKRGVPLPDLIQEGTIGLMTAARKFEVARGYRFSTYATDWIRQGVSRYVLNHGGLIRVPLYTEEQIRKVLTAQTALQQQLGRDPTQAEIGDACGIPENKVRQLLQKRPEVCSLDAPTGDGENTTLRQLLEDVQTPQPQERLEQEELKRVLDRLLDSLTPRQKQVLTLHFGLGGGTCLSLKEIGKEMGISKERARQIEEDAIEKLQRLGAEMGLEDFRQ